MKKLLVFLFLFGGILGFTLSISWAATKGAECIAQETGKGETNEPSFFQDTVLSSNEEERDGGVAGTGKKPFSSMPDEAKTGTGLFPSFGKGASPLSEKSNVMTEKNIGIAIIAPGGYPPDNEGFRRGVALLKSRGYRVFNYYDPAKRYQRFGGTDEQRIHQIEEALANPDVKVVMALRGGYGTTRLLSRLDFAQIAKSGKLFVGYSDFTVFQMALLTHGSASFAGPMVYSDFARKDLSRWTLDHFEKAVTVPEMSVKWSSADNPDIDVEGVFWGGNLSMLAHLTGTKWMPDIAGGILFVEDIHEQPYRVERMLLQLDEAGILKKQKALVLGHFSEFKTADYDNGYDFGTMLSWLRSRLTIPVLTGLPFGHVKDKVTLPIGARAHLRSRAGSVQLDLSDYPTVW